MTNHTGAVGLGPPRENPIGKKTVNSETVENLEMHYRLSEWATEQRDLTVRQHSESITLLHYARALIEEPDRYSPEKEALTEKGRPVSPTNPRAVRFNVHGALQRAACVMNIRGIKLHDAQRSLGNGISNTDFMPRRNSQRTALAALDEAIRIQADNDRRDAMSAAQHWTDGGGMFCNIVAQAAATQPTTAAP